MLRALTLSDKAKIFAGKTILLCFLFIFLPHHFAHATGYSYYRVITVDKTKVGTGTHNNFPVLIKGTFNGTGGIMDLRTVANGGKVTNSSGYDIIFTSDASGAHQLSHEIESYSPTTGEAVFWVNAGSATSTINSTTNAVIYIWYGNSSISTSQQDVTGTWNSDYVAVYHLKDGTTLSLTDSTSKGNNATNNGAGATTGVLDGGASFNGTSQYIILPSTITGLNTAEGTIQLWANMTAQSSVSTPILNIRVDGSNQFALQNFDGTSALNFRFQYAAGGTNSTINTASITDDGINHAIGMTWSKSGDQLKAYYEGSQVGSTVTGLGTFSGTPNQNHLGANTAVPPNLFTKGMLDEFRISSVARSAAWLSTEYNNQSSPSTFYSIGSEQVPDTTSPTAAITYSDSDGIVKSGDSLTITATFDEALLDSPVVKIAISGSNTVAATAMTKTSTTVYTYTHTVGSGDGTATVALSVGTDAAGNVVNSAPSSGATFTVDNTAPTNQDTVFASSIAKQGGATVTIVSSGTATNNVWFAPSGTTSFVEGATMTKASGGTATSILAPATAGTYKLFVIDAAGNQSSGSTATLTVDNTAPTVSLTAPTNASTVSGSSVTLTATAADAVSVAGVQFKVDGTNIGSEDTTSTYGVSWDSTGVSDGSHSLVAVARDTAGNYATSSTVTVTVDNTAPTLSSVTPTDNSTGNATTTNLVLTFNEAVYVGSGNITIKKSSDSSTVETINVTTSQVTGTGTTEITVDPSAILNYSTGYFVNIAATAFADAQGNAYGGISNGTTWNFTSSADASPPVRSAGAPSGNLTSDTTSTTISLTTDEDSTCKYSDTASTSYSSMTAFATTGGTDHSSTVVGLTEGGTFTYYVKCSDSTGNTNLDDYTISFSVDSSKPVRRAEKSQASRASVRSSSFSFSRDIYQGESGLSVRSLQNFLISKGFLGKEFSTGFFGPLTKQALKKYQASIRIRSTGNLGPLTRQAINKESQSINSIPPATETLEISQILKKLKMLQTQLNNLKSSQ